MEDINLTLGNAEQARREESATAEISDAARKTVESLKTIGFSITKPVRAIEMEVEDHKVLILPNGDAVSVTSKSKPNKQKVVRFAEGTTVKPETITVREFAREVPDGF